MKPINIKKFRDLADRAKKLNYCPYPAPDHQEQLQSIRDLIAEQVGTLDNYLIGSKLTGTHCHSAAELLSNTVSDELNATGLSKRDLIGTVITWVSGKSVPNAYKWQRKATRATYVVKSTGLILESISVTEIGKSGGSLKIKLTDQAVATMIKRIEDQYK